LFFFDAHIRSLVLDEARLENLRYFNVKRVLTTAYSPGDVDTAEQLLSYFENLLTNELHRLRTAGLEAYLAIGVHPDAVPRRTHYELWNELPVLLKERSVVALGELALTESQTSEVILSKQLEIAEQVDKPVVICFDGNERVRQVKRVLSLAAEVNFPPDRMLLNHIDFTSLRVAMEAGAWAGVTVNPLDLSAPEACELVRRYGEDALKHVIFNSGARSGVGDVLALPKAALELSSAGFSPAHVRRLTWGNANRFFQVPLT
ncbi:MAG: TatD family hydrolase, partial [Myxococcales bacterium]|nr:TatD family hydrolase [Myxococcales bacterium]